MGERERVCVTERRPAMPTTVISLSMCVCVCARVCVAGDAQEGNVAVAFDVSLALLKGREVRYGNEGCVLGVVEDVGCFYTRTRALSLTLSHTP